MLAAEYPNSEHIRNVGLRNAPDTVIWSYAAAQGFLLVSKDADFRQLALTHGPPPKVIAITLGNCPTATVEALLRSRLADVTAFDADPTAALLILP